MRIIDISVRLDEKLEVYQGDPQFMLEPWYSICENGYMLSRISMGTHTGTHIDAPCHFIEEAKRVDEIPLDCFFGECEVIDDLLSSTSKRVIITKKLSGGVLTAQQAQMVVKKRIKLIGTEALSIGDDDVHRILLGAGCIILERVALDNVKCAKYFPACQPLKIDADGSPVRACLIEGIL